ncbi:unnamed protein product [Sphagnum compactum]
MSLRWLHNPFLDPSVLLSTARLRSRPGKKLVEGYATGGRSAVERTAIPSELLSFSIHFCGDLVLSSSVVDGSELETRQQSAAAGPVIGAFLELRAFLGPRSCMQRLVISFFAHFQKLKSDPRSHKHEGRDRNVVSTDGLPHTHTHTHTHTSKITILVSLLPTCFGGCSALGPSLGHAGAPENCMLLQSMCKNQPHFFQT